MIKLLIVLIIIMFCFFVVSTIRFINDTKYYKKVKEVHTWINEKNLTENLCHMYCYLTRD